MLFKIVECVFSLHKMSKRLLIGITYILFCLSVYSQDYNQLTDTASLQSGIK